VLILDTVIAQVHSSCSGALQSGMAGVSLPGVMLLLGRATFFPDAQVIEIALSVSLL
jgi:hypothetical protein